MPQPILTKYKQGDLGADYPKQQSKDMKNLDVNKEADPEVSTKDYPKQKKQYVQPSVFKMADEKDY